MSKAMALKLYVILLVIATGAFLISLPAVTTVTIGKSLCSSLPSFLVSSCRVIPIPEQSTITLRRPFESITIFGKPIQVGRDLSFGLDIRGGTQVTLATDMRDIVPEDRERAIESAKEVISRRIDLFGVSESSVVTSTVADSYRLLVSIPGVSDAQKAIELIGTTAQLDFREYKPSTPSGTATNSGYLVRDFRSSGLTGKNLKRASVQFENKTGKPTVLLEFNEQGTKQFASLTQEQLGKPVGIFLDEYAVSIPTVETVITDGRAQITGNFSVDDAKSLAVALNAGALPVPITVLSQKTIGPNLGGEAIRKSVMAGFIGVFLVMVFMILLYGSNGIFSVISLVFYSLVTVALYKLIPITLTLPGIAGLLLSIGMAVDTNILVFERLWEEEVKGHKSLTSLLSRSFDRAWDSIKDANITTLITCTVLANPLNWTFLNTSGMIRGFAITLALGICLNLLSGMIVTRVLMTLFYKSKDLDA